MNKTMTTTDLAMIFYNDFLDNGGDILDPDSESHKLMGEINGILEDLIGIKRTMQIEDKILRMNCLDCIDHFVWGFEKALEVARVVYGSETELDQLKKL